MAAPVAITPINDPVPITPIYEPDLSKQNALIDKMQADTAGGHPLLREAALGALGTVLPETQTPLMDAGRSLLDQVKPRNLLMNAAMPLASPIKAGLGLGQQAQQAFEGVGEYMDEPNADTAEHAAHGVGALGGMAAPMAPDALRAALPPAGRATGALLENAGRLARTPISDVKIPLIGEATAAKALGGAAGYAAGRPLGHPFAGAAAGGALGDIAAERVQTAGAKLRDFSGYDRPPAPHTPAEGQPIPALKWSTTEAPLVTEGTTPERFTKQPRLTYGGKSTPPREPALRAAKKVPQPALTYGGRTAPPVEPKPLRAPIPPVTRSIVDQPAETSPIAGPQGQPVAAATPTGRTVITPGEHIDPLRAASAGSAAQATEADLQRLAAVGDQSAAAELTRRRLVREGQPTNYSQVPLPHGPNRLLDAARRK